MEVWNTGKLNSLFILKNDKAKQIKSSEYLENGQYPVVDQSIDFICGYYEKHEKVNCKDLPLTVFGDHTRHVKYVDFPFVAGADGTQLLKPTSLLTDKYLYYLVLFASSRIANHGYDRHLKHLREFEVSFPDSKEEQSTIATILTTIDQAIEKTERLIAKYERIKTGLMQDLLSRGIDEQGRIRSEETHAFKDSALGRIPVEWEVLPIIEITKKDSPICYGIVQVGKNTDNGIPTIAIKDMRGDFRQGVHLTSKEIEANYKRSRLMPGDLLISIKATIGKVAIVPDWFYGNVSRDLARIRLVDSCIPEYYKHYFTSTLGQKSLMDITVGTTRKEVSIAPLRKLEVIVPKKEEQERIAKFLNTPEKALLELTSKKEKLESLKRGLMQDLLTGRVRVDGVNQLSF